MVPHIPRYPQNIFLQPQHAAQTCLIYSMTLGDQKTSENTTKLFCGPNTAGAPQNNFLVFVAQSDPEGQQVVIKYCNKRHLLFIISNNIQ